MYLHMLTHSYFHIHSKYTYSYTWMLPHRLTLVCPTLTHTHMLTHILTHYCLHTYSSMLSNTFTVMLTHIHSHTFSQTSQYTHIHNYAYLSHRQLHKVIISICRLAHKFTHSHKHWYILAITDNSHAVTPFYMFTYLFSCVWVSPSLCRSPRLRLGEHW